MLHNTFIQTKANTCVHNILPSVSNIGEGVGYSIFFITLYAAQLDEGSCLGTTLGLPCAVCHHLQEHLSMLPKGQWSLGTLLSLISTKSPSAIFLVLLLHLLLLLSVGTCS